MTASIIIIGDEILAGEVVDTNSFFLSSELKRLGFCNNRVTVVPDKKEQILQVLADMIGKTDLLLVTGGLGPTTDDITKKTFVEFFNSELIENKEVLKDVERFVALRGFKMNELNRRQALVPDNAKIIRNPYGTAPAMWFEKQGTVIIAMPGVPFEMRQIFTEKIIPLLEANFSLPFVCQKVIHTFGLIEADLAEKLADLKSLEGENISLAFLPSPEDIKIKLTARGVRTSVCPVLDSLEAEIRSRISEYIFGTGNTSLEKELKYLFAKSGKTLAVAESCTGGRVAATIVQVPGSSLYFKGGVVAYSNEIKMKVLNVKESTLQKYGAVSKETVEEMLKGIIGLYETDYGIATSGIAGPSGGTPDKPVGTVWVAVGSVNSFKTKKYQFGNRRDINIRQSTAAAIFELLKILKFSSKYH